MFSRTEIMIWAAAAVCGLVLAYSCRLEAGLETAGEELKKSVKLEKGILYYEKEY